MDIRAYFPKRKRPSEEPQVGPLLDLCPPCSQPAAKKATVAPAATGGGRFACPECDQTFTEKGSVNKHVRAVHRGEKPFACPECDQTFKRKAHVNKHVRAVHRGERPFACPECDQTFSQKPNLDKHVRSVHRGEKPFACPECELKCSSKQQLRIHVRAVHRGERPFACPECDQTFSQKCSVNKHVRAVHRSETRFACPECDKTFTSKGDVNRHVRAVHRGEKPFACPACDQTFTQKGNLDKHVRSVHRGEKPFACPECDKTFTEKSSVNVHVRTVHCGETRFECPDPNCDYRAFYKKNVEKHFKSWHTAEACRRQKKAEAAVEKVLVAARLGFDREARINYGCGLDVEKHWASIDFVLYLPDRVILLEVDEQQHNGYGVGCDAARMSHVHSSLVAENPDRAIVFVRFNPDAFRADGRLVTFPKRERHEQLVTLLRRLTRERTQGAMSPGQLRIIYCHYDEDAAGVPLVLSDEEYPPEMAACVG